MHLPPFPRPCRHGVIGVIFVCALWGGIALRDDLSDGLRVAIWFYTGLVALMVAEYGGKVYRWARVAWRVRRRSTRRA